MTEAETTYFQLITQLETHRQAFTQQYQLVRMWPSEHPFQEMPDDIYEPLKDHALAMGEVQDQLTVAWRAVKKERKANDQ